MVSEGGIQDRLERFITRHPIWVTIGFAGFLFVCSALLLAFFPSLVSFLGLSLQSQAVAEPAIGTQTLLVVVVTGAVALTGLLLSIFQIRHRDQEILLSHAQNLNRAANDAARRIFGLAKSLIKLQQSVQLLYQSFTDNLRCQYSSTPSCCEENQSVKLPPMVEAACQKLEQALVAVIESVHEIRRDPNTLNLALKIARAMIERFGLPDWRDRFVPDAVTKEFHRPKSADPFNPVVFFDALEGLEVTLFYLKDRSRILRFFVLGGKHPLFHPNPANLLLFLG